MKISYLLLLLLSVWRWSSFDDAQLEAINARWLSGWGKSPVTNAAPRLSRHFATWDTEHYLYLSQAGYAAKVKSCAFYPLWPLLVRWSAPVFGGSHLLAGQVLSNLCSLAGWGLFYERVRRRWGAGVAGWALVFLIVFPGSLFFQFHYTESLFFLLMMLLWWGLEERRYGVAAAGALLLPLTRGVGVFAVLPIVWHALTVAPPGWLRLGDGRWKIGDAGGKAEDGGRRAEDDGQKPPTGNGSTASRAPKVHFGVPSSEFGVPRAPWSLLAAPLIGWGFYLALMWHWTGNPFEGFEAQKHWRVHSVWNLADVPKFVVGFLTPTQWHAFTGSVLDRWVFVLLLYTLPVLWRLDKGLLVWMYWLGILPAMSGTFTSYTRFASCAFPMFIALGAFLAPKIGDRGSEIGARTPEIGDGRSKLGAGLRWGLLTVFALLHVVLVWRFVNFRWAG